MRQEWIAFARNDRNAHFISNTCRFMHFLASAHSLITFLFIHICNLYSLTVTLSQLYSRTVTLSQDLNCNFIFSASFASAVTRKIPIEIVMEKKKRVNKRDGNHRDNIE